ncbi:YhjD/YihY/BrkB family envelope integrity protein [uncultured Jatrophihabitans sp.]|uniref:YhjD/YihY/BrkB family envelope integrity protein n=1 Tax=uncultured Jatrophihabitans sp. TaxID=1610747 RepID=UPI0035CB6B88
MSADSAEARDDDGDDAGTLTRAKDEATGRWAALQARYRWLRHVLEAYQLLTRNHGNQYAGAITYFSFLALFPLLLLAVSVVGFILHAHPAAQQDLFKHITDQVPGQFGTTLKTALQTAIDKRAGVGIVGLVGVLLTGLGWISNLREAIDAVWGRQPPKRNFVMSRVSNLIVLGALGLGLLVSLALTAVGTSLTKQVLTALSLDSLPGFTILLKVIGIAISVLGDMVIFYLVLVRMPQMTVSRRTAIKGVLLASVGFEILKILGTYTIAKTSHSPTAGPFAGVIAILVWIQLVCRYMLFACAWMATAVAADRAANSVPVMPSEVGNAQASTRRTRAPGAPAPAAVAATLVGAGAVAGLLASWSAARAAMRKRPRA